MAVEVIIPDRSDFKIGEVCEIASVKPFVLRYWETEFPALTPTKGAGGQRSYSRVDVELILRIKHLLYEERFTVAGAKKRLAEEEPTSTTEQPQVVLQAPPDAAPMETPKTSSKATQKTAPKSLPATDAPPCETAVAIDSVPPVEVERLRQAIAEARRELQALVEKLT